MTTPTELDVFSCALDGATLIEASAGTGKTWNICGLYLRLLLERELGVQQILVVTFTNAATAELRERIRARIAETLAFLHGSGAPAGDPFVPALVASVAERHGQARERMAQLLDLALQAFDEAAIFTIHGFCQRALADTPFAAGVPFANELVPDDRAQLLEAVYDFWRRRIGSTELPPELAATLLQYKDTPQGFARLLKRHLAKPKAQTLWPAPAADGAVDQMIDSMRQLFAEARQVWSAEAAAIRALLAAAQPDLKASHGAEKIGAALAECEAFFRNEQAPPLAPSLRGVQMKLLRQGALAAAVKQGKGAPTHAFFTQLEHLLAELPALQQRLAAARDGARLQLLRRLLEEAGPELRRKKREQRITGYDDMLFNVYDALTGGHTPWLAQTLRARYPAALIDEFQDTDPLQFAIFDAVYGGSDAPLFLVGDPKQAIYSFRNADLHTYLQAKDKTGAAHTLSGNQRSSRGLIEGLNALFGANPAAFMLPGLDYQRVQFGHKPRKAFIDHSEPRAELQLWLLPADDGAVIERGAARRAAIAATAAEIARLIGAANRGQITLDGRPLRPGDIAVLVRSHGQGSEVRAALAALDIGSVELSQASVFESSDAADLEAVLCAVLEPTRSGLLLAALATPLLGRDAAAIAAISADERQLMAQLDRFNSYRELWLGRGVGFMLRQLLADDQVSARMLCRPDGERRLTNLLHLLELLHRAAQQQPSPDALLRWLQAQRRAEGGDEASQLRLESDQNLVQIVTIHKSKGLEYPVVFCPLLWSAAANSGGLEGLEYHAADGRSVIDFRTDDAAIDAARRAIKLEQSAETLRLIYVALTRAAQRCYLVAGNYARRTGKSLSLKEGTHNLLNWLVAGAGRTPEQWFADELAPGDINHQWQALAAGNAPHIGLAPLPSAAGIPVRFERPAADALAALPPPAPIHAGWRSGSFSLLSHGAASERAASDHDARIATAAPVARAAPLPIGGDDILQFPRGPAAGDCLHAVFEAIDFSRPEGWEAAIAQALAAHPQPAPDGGSKGEPDRARWQATQAAMIRRMLHDVLATPLADGIRLQTIPLARRLTELEFRLPAPHISAGALNRALREAGYEVPELAFRDLAGYLNGFIDLVFEHQGRYYLLDWKSNHLGHTPDDYGPAALAAAMAQHGYHLQYLLYAVALQRYLRQRLPNYEHARHFGGVLYLFVRGVRPAWTLADGTPAGVFFHRPGAQQLAAIEQVVAPHKRPEAA